MTWWAEDTRQTESVVPGTRARQRWEQLRYDALEVSPPAPAVGETMRVRWIMSGWQTWRRVDAMWCEFIE